PTPGSCVPPSFPTRRSSDLRPGEVGVEAAGHWRWHKVPDLTEAWLHTLAVAAAAFTRQDVDAEHPICSTVLPGNERCQIVLPPRSEEHTSELQSRENLVCRL